MPDHPGKLIKLWLVRQLDKKRADWLAEKLENLEADPSDRNMAITLGMIPRTLGKDDLALSAEDLVEAQKARTGWNPADWSVDEAARVLALLKTASANIPFVERFTEVCRTAEFGELMALYRGLPLYPDQAALVTQAREGLRTNMRSVFEAIAHNNPFTVEQFDEDGWNQMVLKALFIGSPLYPIQSLDKRANPELARIMCDYAHERWAAGRDVTPEIWRCVGPFAEGTMIDDLKRALDSNDPFEIKAAALALAASSDPAAKVALDGEATLRQQIESGALSWDSLADELKAGA